MISRTVMLFAWAWIIIVGGIMITPGGITCIACITPVGKAIAVISILFGAYGLFTNLRGNSLVQR